MEAEKTGEGLTPGAMINVFDVPHFWRDEIGGELAAAVYAYFGRVSGGPPPTARQVDLLRLYLLQWINAPCWAGPQVDELRKSVRLLNSVDTIDLWIDKAMDTGIDPF